jgi:hypothetical protein
MKSRVLAYPSIFRAVVIAATFSGFASGLFIETAQAVTLNSKEQQLSGIFKSAGGQHRPFLVLDPILCAVARAKAQDMGQRNYFGHVNPDGKGPNYLVEKAGYPLPDWWGDDPRANYIESIGAGYSSASAVWGEWMESSGHRRHLLAESSFYRDQTAYGVGFANVPGSDYQYYWVIITAPAQAGAIVTINHPAKNLRTEEAELVASGEAAPNGVNRIEWSIANALGESDWQIADGIENWSATISNFAPGQNTLRVRTITDEEEVGTIKTRQFTYVVWRPLTVSVEGMGSVTPQFAGETMRELAAEYTVKATPSKDWLFAGWTGGVSSMQRKIKFTMTEGLELTANFVPNPFPDYAGKYQVLMTIDDQLASFILKLNGRGLFTGKLLIGAKTYRASGAFDALGNTELNIADMTIALNLGELDGTLSMTIDEQNIVMNVAATDAGALAGRYHVALPAEPEEAGCTCPKGIGYAVLKVRGNGKVRMVGRLGDRVRFARGMRLTQAGEIPLFLRAKAGLVVVAGVLGFGEPGEIGGELTWRRGAKADEKYYADGFHTVISASGSLYSSESAPQFQGGTLTIRDGSLPADIVETIVDPYAPHVPGEVTVKIKPRNGIMRGRFIHSADSKKRTFSGLVVSGEDAALGCFRGIDETGSATLVEE